MAGSQRYLRYILFAFVCLVVFYFISSSSETPRSRLQSPGEIIKEQAAKWKGEVKDKTPQVDLTGDKQDEAAPSESKGEPPEQPPHESADKPDDGVSDGSAVKEEEGTGESKPKPKPKTPANGNKPSNVDARVSGKLPSLKDLAYDTTDMPKMNATFVTLARNADVWEIAESIRQVEDRFNRFYNYDWVFLNDKEFDDTFKKITSHLVSGNTKYGLIPEEHWSFPDFIDQSKAEEVRKEMKEKKIIYGDSISYRHMCRYESGFFYRHPLMMDYEWYWRVEPSVKFFCDIHYDPFRFMADNKKKYSFVLSLYEYKETIPTLWDSAKKFIKNHPEHIAEDNSMDWISDDKGETYNHCHFWSNFEIGNLEWLRGKAYSDYFDTLDQDGGFFYERWGDAPVHSIAAALTLRKDEIHFFNDISYYHVPFTHCPTGEQLRLDLGCHCNPKDNFDWNGYSCLARYFEINKIEKPEGYEQEQ